MKHSFKEITWLRRGAIGSTALMAAIAFHLLRPSKLQSMHSYYGNAELNGQTTDATFMPGTHEPSEPGRFVLKDIHVEQMGPFPTDRVTAFLYFSDALICEPELYKCHSIGGNKGFKPGFQWSDLSRINPKESWPAPGVGGVAQGSLPMSMKARVEIFYGEARPAEADFTVNARNVHTC